MSSKAAPRKAGAIFAAALALASVFNTGASAQETFRVSGNVSGPRVTDAFGLELPGCRNGNAQRVSFIPRPSQAFTGTNDLYFAYDYARSQAENDGPTVYYNYQMLQIMPEGFRNFMLYQACIMNYSSDQALRRPINKTDYTVYEIKADCSAVIRLRDENRFTTDDLRSLEMLLNVEDREAIGAPPTEKAQRRLRNITQCYYHNTTAENLTPAPKPSRG